MSRLHKPIKLKPATLRKAQEMAAHTAGARDADQMVRIALEAYQRNAESFPATNPASLLHHIQEPRLAQLTAELGLPEADVLKLALNQLATTLIGPDTPQPGGNSQR